MMIKVVLINSKNGGGDRGSGGYRRDDDRGGFRRDNDRGGYRRG